MIGAVPSGHRQSPDSDAFLAALAIGRISGGDHTSKAAWGPRGHLREGFPAALCWCWHQRAPEDPAPAVADIGHPWGGVLALSGVQGFVPYTTITPAELVSDVESRPGFYLHPARHRHPPLELVESLRRHFGFLWLYDEHEDVRPPAAELSGLLDVNSTPIDAAAAAISVVNEQALASACLASELPGWPAVGEACPNLALEAGLLFALAPAARLEQGGRLEPKPDGQ